MILPGARIVQMAWVVDSLERSAERLSKSMQVGPFLMIRHIKLDDPHHRGQPQRSDFSLCLAQAGDVQIELVEQHDSTPSVYRDVYPDGPPGGMAFHHVAVIVPDVFEETARYNGLGFPTASSGRFGAVDFAYVDTTAAGGFMVEILPDRPEMHRFFDVVRSAAEDWNGEVPWREFA
ncbi:MAG TPA: VOC family protein [Sphingomicrobium sp.]|nr:VOC family protein [Sphingomicrobium sp.]